MRPVSTITTALRKSACSGPPTGSVSYTGDTAISVAYRHVNSDVPAPSEIADFLQRHPPFDAFDRADLEIDAPHDLRAAIIADGQTRDREARLGRV